MIFDGAPAEYAELQKRGVQDFQKRILAVWEVAAGKPGEPDWIERLAQAGDADRLFQNSNHSRYICHAFFVKRLEMCRDIELHWDRRKAIVADLIATHGSTRYVLPGCAWLIVSYFSPERLHQCPAEAVLTIDALNTVLPIRQ